MTAPVHGRRRPGPLSGRRNALAVEGGRNRRCAAGGLRSDDADALRSVSAGASSDRFATA